jgi:hypothetical protein
MTAPTISASTQTRAAHPVADRILGAGKGGLLAQPAISTTTAGLTLVAATPSNAPELWSHYVDGAWASYERHKVTEALDLDEVASGATTTLFYVVLGDDGSMLGGVRAQGPYTMIEQSHVFTEWQHSPGLPMVQDRLRTRIGEGIVEMKSAWVDAGRAGRTASTVLARTALPTLELTNSRFLFASAADHVLRLWETSGGCIDETVPAAAYPNDAYRTQMMWWDRMSIAEHADPQVFSAMAVDTAALTGNTALIRRTRAAAQAIQREMAMHSSGSVQLRSRPCGG